jgi:hypothetical protein
MGADFISKAGKTYRKGWDRERRKLSIAELFNRMPERIRAIVVTPFDLPKFCDGGRYELSVQEGRIFVYSNRETIGVCTEPPRSVVRAISALGGRTLGVFLKVREHSGRVEVAVCLDTQSKTQAA